VDSNGGNTQTTLYIGGVEKITRADGTKRVKRHIAGVVIETESYTSGGSLTGEERHYSLKDHLGSQDTLTDSTGNVIANGGQLSFDPWGQRRNATAWSNLDSSQIIANYGVFASLAPPTTRGFTNHEMADEVGIIHMNGRIYDPKLGRFLQADPFVQAPDDLQMYNRYSYVRNNPLNATDPSGYFKLRQWMGAIVAVVGAVFCGAPCSQIGWQMIALGAVSGAAGAAANGGNILQGAILGGVSAAAFGAAGELFPYVTGAGFEKLAMNALANGVAGGITNVLAGGKFGHGFVPAGLSALSKPGMHKLGTAASGLPLRVAARAIIGGTISELTGGKFANGAGTAAFAQLFNDELALARERNAQEGCGGRPCVSRGGADRATVGEGAQSLFDDLFRVRYHYRALAGEFGLGEQLYALSTDATITHALKAYYDGGDISKIDGLTISVNGSTDLREVVNSQVGALMRANQDFMIGRLGAQAAMNYTVGRVSGAGLYGSIGVGSGTFGIATFGRGLTR